MMNTRLRCSPFATLALCLIASCAASAPVVEQVDTRVEPATLEGPLGELVADLMYGDAGQRSLAAEDLASLGGGAAPAAEHLVLALDDEEPEVRALAAEALGLVGGDPSMTLKALNLRLRKDRDEAVQAAASAAMARLGPISQESFLAGLRDQRASVRWESARGFGRLGEDAGETLGVLLEALEDENAHVRWSAAKAIGHTNQDASEVIQPLIRALTDDVAEVRANAAYSLGRCGRGARRAVLPLVDALRDEASGVRIHAARALGELGEDAAQASMDLSSALDDPDPEVVEEVRAALEAIQQG